jgi:DNA uptake protein ComE-like DNA-binding protein
MAKKQIRSQSSQSHAPGAAAGSSSQTARAPSKQDGVGNEAIRQRTQGAGAKDKFAQATQGAGSPLPDAEKLSALFGADLSDVRVHWGDGAALGELGAKAATDGKTIAMGPNADQTSLIEEVAHVVQARQTAGGPGGGTGTSEPGQRHERAAKGVAKDVQQGAEVDSSQLGGLTGSAAIHRDEDAGALTYARPTEEVDDPNHAQSDLDATPEQKAQQLGAAIRGNDMREIYSVLGGDNQAVKDAYVAYFGRTVQADMRAHLGITNLTHALAYARYGKADIASRVQAVTWDIIGTDEDKLYQILENATMEERLALANNRVALFDILNDTSGAVRERCMQVLRPLMNNSALSEAARQALFDRIRQDEAELGNAVDTLMTRLRARKGWLNDDEAGMISDVEAWVTSRGGGFPDLDTSKGEPAELMPAVNWLRGELSSREYEQVLNLLKSGGERSTMDKIDEAGADTSWGFSNVDENGIYQALTDATPEERQAILNDPVQLHRILGYLDQGTERERALAILRGTGTGDTASAYQELLAELDGWLWASDATIYSCLERMSTSELVRLRGDAALVKKIEGRISDVSRFHALIGYTGKAVDPNDPDAAATAENELKASNERLVSRIEHAVDSWDDNEDQVYLAVIEWQSAGGVLSSTTDQELLTRAHRALGDLDVARRKEILDALYGRRLVTWKDRMESAAAGWGTDDTAMDDMIQNVPDIVLVREWSNLSVYKAQAEAAETEAQVSALANFIVDIDNDIKFMLKKERSDWRDMLGDLRGKLITALRTAAMAEMAEREFKYVPRAELLTRLQYAQARSLSDHDRGPGFWNGISMGFNDLWSETGTNTEQAFGVYRTEATEAVLAEDGSEEETAAVEEADAAYQTYLQSHEEYEAAKAASAAIAGAIVGVIVATIVTIATAGTAGPACAGFLGAVMGAAFTELTEAAIQGNSYDVDQGAVDLTSAVVTGLITLGMGQVVDKLAKGAAATARVQAVNAALKARFGDTFARFAGNVGKTTLSAALSDFPSNYAKDLIKTEGLLRQEMGGVGGAIQSTLSSYGTKILTSGIQHAVNDRTDLLKELRTRGEWDEYADALVKKGLIDLGIATVASQVLAGRAPNAQDMVKLICKVASTTTSGRASAAKAQRDVASTLAFFNSADSRTLQSVPYIGQGIAGRIIQARGAGGFTSLQDLLDIPYFTERVLSPAAMDIRDDFNEKRAAEKAASPTPSSGDTSAAAAG